MLTLNCARSLHRAYPRYYSQNTYEKYLNSLRKTGLVSNAIILTTILATTGGVLSTIYGIHRGMSEGKTIEGRMITGASCGVAYGITGAFLGLVWPISVPLYFIARKYEEADKSTH